MAIRPPSVATSLSSISVLIAIPVSSVLRKMFRAPSLTTDQSYKLTRLPVREPPRLAGLEILDHYAAIAAGGYLKWAGRERYGHCGSLMSVGRLVRAMSLVTRSLATQPIRRSCRPTAATHSSGETFTMIRVAAAMQPWDRAYAAGQMSHVSTWHTPADFCGAGIQSVIGGL